MFFYEIAYLSSVGKRKMLKNKLPCLKYKKKSNNQGKNRL